MLKLVENIEFIKNRKLEVNKIDEKEFILENKRQVLILKNKISQQFFRI